MISKWFLTTAIVVLTAILSAHAAQGAEPIDIGNRRELFLDYYLIEKMTGSAELRLHKPVMREVALTADQPWEGNVSAYHTVFRDGDIYRMYYRAWHLDSFRLEKTDEDKIADHEVFTCYAESEDGIHWKKPALGLVEFNGSKENNILLKGRGFMNFAPFKDANPNAKPERRYKAFTGIGDIFDKRLGAVNVFTSPDGFKWSYAGKTLAGSYTHDTINTAFWDTVRGEYRAYFRDNYYLGDDPDDPEKGKGMRAIKTATSNDFSNWSEAHFLQYQDGIPRQQLYTNGIHPYARAPHIFIGFPKRFVNFTDEKGRAAGPNPAGHWRMTGISDAVFMSSRDGLHFNRWPEAIVRPGPQRVRWVARNNLPAWGTVITPSSVPGAPPEVSMYTTENYGGIGDAVRLRRYTFRLDGFVSLHAGLGAKNRQPLVAPNDPQWSNITGGEVLTRPLIFNAEPGKPVVLNLNVSTSAAGSVRVELQDASGEVIPGYALDDCDAIRGDAIDYRVTWKKKADVSALAKKPVRLLFEIRDADVYALQFKNNDESAE